MKNIYLKLRQSSKAMMLVMMTTFFAFEANAQTITITTEPDGIGEFAGQAQNDLEFDNSSDPFPAGTTFILYYDMFDEAHVLGTTTTVGTAVDDLDFNWPDVDANVSLFLGAYSGDVFTSEQFDIENLGFISGATPSDNLTGGNTVIMDRAGARSLATEGYEIDFDETVNLTVNLSLTNIPDGTSYPIRVQYSTDAGANYSNLDIAAETSFDIDNNGALEFDLSSLAGTQTVQFRVLQEDASELGANVQSWTINDMFYAVGDVYTLETGVTPTATFAVDPIMVTKPVLTLASIENDVPAVITGGTAFPGDEITVTATLSGVDPLSQYNYSIVLEDSDGNDYVLETSSNVSVLPNIVATGSIPVEISYDDMDVRVYAHTGSDLLIALNETFDFTMAGEADEFIVVGGAESVGNGLAFSQAGIRSVTSEAFNITTATDSYLEFDLARVNDLLSPSGTDLIIEYSTDGATYEELTTVAINSLSFGGSTTVTIEGADWPTGIISSSTQIQVRQEANNGENLDSWYLIDMDIVSGSNIVTENITYATPAGLALEVLRPAITLDPVVISSPGLAYPGTALTFTYEITDGAFPSSTSATLLLDRVSDPEFDIVLGTITDITAETISFEVPPLEAGDYTLYLSTGNDEDYYSVSLPIYDLDIEITDIIYNDPIVIGEDDFTYPGSSITVEYTIGGTPGSGAELMLSVYDATTGVEDYVMIGASTTFDGSITATLPTGIDYDPAEVRLSVTTGIFDNNVYSVQIVDESFYNEDIPATVIESSQGLEFFSRPDAFVSTGERSVTSVPFNFEYGGALDLDLYTTHNFTGSFDIQLQGTVDGGTTWEDIEEVTFTSLFQTQTFNLELPNTMWSDEFQFRLIYNEDGEFDYQENVVKFYTAELYSPEFMETSGVVEPLNLIIPSLDVEEYSKTDFVIDEEVIINYNAQGFPAGTEYAAVIEQGSQYYVAGTSAGQDASSITATMPIVLPIDENDEFADYDLIIVPFTPATAGGDYSQGETIIVDQEEDFLSIEGDDSPNDYDEFLFELTGDRSLLTRAFDLSAAESAEIQFDFNDYYGDSFDINDNKNIVPRLQVSVDGGATFEEIAVYELEDGEEQIYDDGLLYLEDDYSVDVPTAYLTSATHFRWIQPLNLGNGENEWSIEDIVLVINSGNAISDDFYTTTNNPTFDIDLEGPDLNDYVWVQSDLDDPVFNGETFNYDWNFNTELLTTSTFPDGTVYTFTIDEEDPETGENIVIGTTTALGDDFSASVPLFLENDSYDVMLTAMLTIDGEDYYIYKNEDIASLDVFLKAIATVYIGDENAVIYAGQTVNFGIEIENDETTSDSFAALYANLIVDDGSDDWLLAAQLGSGDISADLPPFLSGDYDFRIEFTEDAPIGTVGEIIENEQLENLENDEDNFISGDVDEFDDVTFNNSSGRGLITTRDFEVGELDGATLLEFDIFFNELPEDLTADQFIVFEYSLDQGATYTEIASFPEVGAEEILNYDKFGFTVSTDMMTNMTRFRWRQEEIKGDLYLENISISFGEALPFDYVDTEIDIADQALLISSIGSEEACNGADITISYEIRGRFGADNIVTVYYDSDFTGDDEIDGYEFNLVEGTGSIVVALPNDVLDEGDNNENFKFYLYADDDTYDGNNFTVDGPYSEQSVEYVAPIDSDAEFSVNDILGCESEEVIVDIDDVQDYFLYEIRDAATATVLGSLTYDPEIDDTEINIGAITTTVELELAITSNTSSGIVCNTLVSDFEKTVEILPNFELFLYNNDLGMYETVVSGDAITICEGNEDIFLRPIRILEDGSFDYAGSNEVEWFKGDISTPFATGTGEVLDSDSDITESGSYFARITEGSCVYTTLAIQITVVERPDKPVITVVSGDLEGCEGVDDVVLAAPTGFAYYLWSTGETTETITVGQTDTYTVQISDFPFGTEGTCESESSTSIAVVRSNLPVLDITTTDDIATGRIGEGDTFTQCEGMTVYFHQDQATSSSLSTDLTIEIMRDGVSFASTQSDNYNLEESGNYSFTVRNEDLNVDCFNTSVSFDLTIVDQITDVPVLTSTGDLEFCTNEGSSVLLTAPAGFAVYNWFRNGSSISSNIAGFDATSNTLEVIENGTYSVQVGNVTNCYSPVSNIITVSTKPLPSVPSLSSGSQTDATCGPGPVTFVFNGDNLYSYQLINAMTGQASGNPVVGGDALNSYITSESISEETPFYMEVSYADGSGCTTFNEFSTFTGEPNNVSLELDGNTLEAVISDYSGRSEIRWYRNGTELKNRVNNTSINITDAATYSVEVDFEGVGLCTVTSNAIDLGTAPTGRGRLSETSIDATTFPNPVVSSIKIKIEDESVGVFEVEVMTLSGQVVLADRFENEIGDEEHSISVNGLQSGIYTLTIRQGARITSKRLFIQ